MTNSSPTDLEYPSILCPLPRRTHSHPYHPHHPPHYYRSHSSHHLHHYHQPKSPSTSYLLQHHHYHPAPTKPLSPSSHPHTPFTPTPTTATQTATIILNSSSTPTPIKLNSDDEVLSEFLSLFNPSSPRSPIPIIIDDNPDSSHDDAHSRAHPVQPSAPVQIGTPDAGPHPIHPMEPSDQSVERTQSSHCLGTESHDPPQPHLALAPKHLSTIVSSPISRCHNPLPRHAELDRLASRLSKPFASLQLADREEEQRPLEAPEKAELHPADQVASNTHGLDEVVDRDHPTEHSALLLPALDLNPPNRTSSPSLRLPSVGLAHHEPDHQ